MKSPGSLKPGLRNENENARLYPEQGHEQPASRVTEKGEQFSHPQRGDINALRWLHFNCHSR